MSDQEEMFCEGCGGDENECVCDDAWYDDGWKISDGLMILPQDQIGDFDDDIEYDPE